MHDIQAAYLQACERGDHALADTLATTLNSEPERHEAWMRSPHALAQTAAWYAKQGIPVFPCVPRGKKPLIDNGFKGATTDLEQVNAWWRANPQANIGAPTGIAFDVIDVDGPEGVSSMLDRFADLEHVGVPVIARTLTPRPGGHHLFIPPSGAGNKAGLYPSVDFRGIGGYVILPPSVGVNGNLYRWLRPLGGTE